MANRVYLDKINVKISDLNKAKKVGDNYILNPAGAWVIIYRLRKTKPDGVNLLYNAEIWLSRFRGGRRDLTAIVDLQEFILGSKNYYFDEKEAGVILEKKICQLLNDFLKECHINLKR